MRIDQWTQNFHLKKNLLLIKEIKKNLGKEVIKESIHEESNFISLVILVPVLRDFIPYLLFKIETISTLTFI